VTSVSAAICAVAPLCAVLLIAQSSGSFDVASIKQNASGNPGGGLDMSKGQLRATNLPLQMVMRQAFEVMDSQIVDAPAWVASERYDIVAKAPPGVTTAEALRPLMRALLADRFKLSTHVEKREMPVYALLKARADGTLGPTFRQSPIDCAANAGSPPAGAAAPKQAGWDDWLECSVMLSPAAINFGGYRMTDVTRILAGIVGRTVLDETGVTGPVQLRLRYQPAGRGGAPAAADPAGDDRPNIFTALQEQAGLKLDARRAAVDVLVIDRIERPTED
jgi:uncharacterized protein (TIGR03435 family)